MKIRFDSALFTVLLRSCQVDMTTDACDLNGKQYKPTGPRNVTENY